ncbi:metal-dependent hydrolase [Croceicoccus sp. YJ47]|uniref:metal-dependent hydrolase n=1 Tax=Croceicoccus sp. YJ47 TaxID=2798724 RepID=UPI0035301568
MAHSNITPDLTATAPAGLMPPVAIQIRNRRFKRGEPAQRWWAGGDPFATAVFNSLSITFPKGEAYFIRSVKAHRKGAPPELAAQIRDFVTQEVNHTREHVAFNKAVTNAGYDIADLERQVDEDLAEARQRPVIFNLAATMALEHFTAMFAHQLLADPRHLRGVEGDAAYLWRWHAVEEIEHKGVAYDTYAHATRDWSRWKRYKLKSVMMLLVTKNFLSRRYRGAIELLRQDGITGPRAHLGVLRHALLSPGILRKAIPDWLSYFKPGFHPWNLDDSHLLARYDAGADTVAPHAAGDTAAA